MQELVIYGVSFDMVGKQPIVLLKTVEGNRFLPIWIGHAEASAILMKLQGTESPRPMTHDLMSDLTLARSESLKRVGGVQLLPATGSDWRSGWRLTAANGDLLVQRNPMGASLQVLTAPTAVSFDARGMVSADSPVKFGLSDGRGSQRCIVLDPSGRPKSLSTACSP